MAKYSSHSPMDELRALRARLATAEQALVAEQSRRIFLEQLVSTLNDAVIVVDDNQCILEWSEGAERVYGWRADEVRGQNLQELLKTHFFNHSSIERAYFELNNQGVWRELVIQYHRDGHELYVESAVRHLHDAAGQVIGLVGVNRDVTARKQAEARLDQREAQLAGIIDSAMDAIITLDDNHRIVLFNRTAEQVFHITAAEVLGQTLNQFVPAEASGIHDQHITAFGATGITRRSMAHPSVVDAIRADGSRFPIEATISQIEVAGQHFFTVILRDLSERKQLEAQLLQAQKLESVGRLAGGIAHDFNNLLTTISGAAELAQTALPVGHAAQADLTDILQTVQRSAALTRRLLAFARQQVLAPRVLDLNQLLRDIEPLLHRLLGTSVALRLVLAPGLAPILADTSQLEQVVMNLAVNARDAMPSGGQLLVSTQAAAGQLGELASDYVRLTVKDSGQGIPADVLPYIFEPFFTTKPVGKGTGLGLSTSYGIVMQHGGQIEVQSTLGHGTIFTIDLPARRETIDGPNER